jgi:hypothetical protein
MVFDPTTVPQDTNKDTLEVIQNYGVDLSTIHKEIQTKEDELAELKESFKDISERKLPDLMVEMGITELKLSDGSVIKKEDVLYSRIKDPKIAFKWLRDNGEEAIIDNKISMNFKKGNDDIANEVIDYLVSKGVDYNSKEDVHWKRLESFIKEVLQNPELKESLPKAAFGVYEGEVVKFKPKNI